MRQDKHKNIDAPAAPRGLVRLLQPHVVRLILLASPVFIAFVAAAAGIGKPERELALAAAIGIALHLAGLISYRRWFGFQPRAKAPVSAPPPEAEEIARARRHELAWTAAAVDEVRQRQLAHSYFLGALKPRLDDEPARRLVADAQDAASGAGALLDQLVEVAHFAAAPRSPHTALLRAGEALAAAVRETHPLAQSRGVRVRIVASSAQLQADPILAAAMLKTLLVHAIVSAAGNKVLVGVRRDRHGPRFEVWTTGGLPRGASGPAPIANRLADMLNYRLEPRGASPGANAVTAMPGRLSRLS